MPLNESRFPDRGVAVVSDVEKDRKIQNSSAGMTSRSYLVDGKTIMVMACEVDREWTTEEYVSAITALKRAAPTDSVPSIEQLKIVTPSDVPDTETCTLYVTAHPRWSEIIDNQPHGV